MLDADNPLLKHARTHFKYAVVLKQKELLGDAALNLQSALEIFPEYADAHSLLGEVRYLQRNFSGAVESFRSAAQFKRNSPSDLDFLSRAQQQWAKEAWHCVCGEIHTNPHDIDPWRTLVKIAACEMRGEDFPLPEDDLMQAMTDQSRNLHELFAIGLYLIQRTPCFPQVSLDIHEYADTEALFYAGAFRQLLSSPLLGRILEIDILCDPAMERLITSLRRILMESVFTPRGESLVNCEYLPFVCSLAMHCFNNNYVFFVTDGELGLVQKVREILEGEAPADDRNPGLLALYGAYSPLDDLTVGLDLAGLCDRTEHRELACLLRQQVREVTEEKQLRALIPRLTPVVDDISNRVQNQYEDHPYPRWNWANLPQPVRFEVALSEVTGLLPPDNDLELVRPAILVAGCGTGHQPIHTASWFPEARILAVDLSCASLAYAMRRARDLKHSTITFMQGDILELGSLGQRFDMIECGGVLHHLADPLAGWRVLTNLLKRDGAMIVGLYSRLARRHLNAARSFIVERGYGSTVEDIRAARQELLALPAGASSRKVLESKDFYSMNGCRDLLFHVQEHQFDLAEISAMLGELQLEFLGFQVSEEVKQRFQRSFPGKGALRSLPLWGQFEEDNPDTFINMYQFWVGNRGERLTC
jgi:SAM-dependent methyltransferase